MTSMTAAATQVVGGIDTHKELHVAAVLERDDGRLLDTHEFSTTRARIYEVDRPDRRRRGKSDTIDAEMAARAVLSGRRLSLPKAKDGTVETLRVLRLTRATAVRSWTKALQLLRNHAISAPAEVRDMVRSLTPMQLIRTVAAWRPDYADIDHPATATRVAMRSLARRILDLGDEIADLDDLIVPLVNDVGAALLERPCIGVETAGQLLVTAGGNPERLRSEAAWAMLCGVAPLPASSGATDRHRLNRGGDRQANRALHMIASADCAATTTPRRTPRARPPRASPSSRSSAASSATSRARSTRCSSPPRSPPPGTTAGVTRRPCCHALTSLSI